MQEEIGLRGATTSAYGIDPHVGIAVDVTHATDCPTIDKKQEGDIGLGNGPVIYRGPNMNPQRRRAADRRRPTSGDDSLSARGQRPRHAGTDANAIQISRGGVATGLVSIPNRYMHSPVEMISLDDIDRAADLLAAIRLVARRRRNRLRRSRSGSRDFPRGKTLLVFNCPWELN